MKKLVLNWMTNIVLVTGLFLALIIYSYGKIGSDKQHFSFSKVNNQSSFATVYLMGLFEKEIINEITLNKQNYFDLHRSLKYTSSIKLNADQARVYQKHSESKAQQLKNILTNNKSREQFKYVMNRAAELQLPKELALIPIIESQYNLKAVSHVGAGGPWQLMPGTAKEMGITNKQRFELEPSTVAALSYFKQLYKKLGNWELVIAAYNAGGGRVHQALVKNPNARTVQDLKLPLETRNYVQSFFQLQNELQTYDV